jgi:hypothetical protein
MVTVNEDRARFRQDPQQEQEWLRQLSLIYSGLIGIGVVMIQPFLTAASLDLTAKICVVAFSVAIPLLAALVVVNRQEVFRGRATPSVLASTARVVAQGSAFTGVVAGFWHILWIAGVGMLAGGLWGKGALGGLVAPGTGPAGAAQGRRGTRRHQAIARDEHKQHSNPEPTEHAGSLPVTKRRTQNTATPSWTGSRTSPRSRTRRCSRRAKPAAMEAWLGSSTLSPFLTAERTRARVASSRRSSKASRHSGSRPC